MSDEGYTALHLAAANGHTDLVRWLAINCADLNMVTQTGYLVTHMAALSGHVQCLMVRQRISKCGFPISFLKLQAFFTNLLKKSAEEK